MHDPFDITTVIFAILAIFVVWKLRSVLGTRTGAERPPFDPFSRVKRDGMRPDAGPGDGKVIQLPGAATDLGAASSAARNPPANPSTGFAEPGSALATGLDAVASADRTFSPQEFLDGAKAAYEMVVSSFAAGDRSVLRNLLANEVYDSFVKVIDGREQRGEKVESTFVSIDKATIQEAALRGSTAQVAVRFLSKLISVTRDRAGKVIEGSPDTVADMVDDWTFARDVNSRDPNWKLVATETVH